MKDTENKTTAYGLVPFYYDKTKSDVLDHVEYLKNTVAGLRQAGIVTVIVVDDGSGIPLRKDELQCDELITLKENSGKTGSVITGIHELLKKSYPDLRYIVQCDYDADQDPKDSELLIQKLQNTEKLSLVIGDRYTTAQPDPLPYRRAVLRLQELLCKKMGYNIQDTVSGFVRIQKSLQKNLPTCISPKDSETILSNLS